MPGSSRRWRAPPRSTRRGAHEAAIAYARRALDEPPDPARRRELLWQLVRASVRGGDKAALADLDSEVLDELTSEPRMLMASAQELTLWLDAQGRVEDGLALLERAKAAALEAQDYDVVMLLDLV